MIHICTRHSKHTHLAHHISTHTSILTSRANRSLSIEDCTRGFSVKRSDNFTNRKTAKNNTIYTSTKKKIETSIKPVLCAYVLLFIPTAYVQTRLEYHYE
jgi:hypothetical protein